MAKAKNTRQKVKVDGTPYKPMGRPRKQQPNIQEQPENVINVTVGMQPGDQHEQDINMPVNKTELMLIGLALQNYRQVLQKTGAELSPNVKSILLRQVAVLEKKVVSNEISYDSLYGKQG